MKNIEITTDKQLNTIENKLDFFENRVTFLEHENEELKAKVNYYEEQFRLNQARKFGSSSEKTSPDQLSFFNEAEKESRDNLEEPDLEEITYKRKHKKTKKKRSFDDLPIETIEYRLDESEMVCQECNHPLHEMSKEIRKELVIIPAQVKVVEHMQYIYSCRYCEKENIKTPVITAKMPKPVLPGSFVSPSLLAFITDKKYAQAMPLYRQEKQFINFGINISRQNMANWILHGSNTWLKILYDRMHSYLLKESVVNADETPMQVLDEPGKAAKSKSYMWLYATGANTEKQIFLYEYQQSRASKHPKKFLKSFSGFLQIDGYPGYNAVENVTLVGCLAHARRKYTDTLKALPKDSDISKKTATTGFKYCNKLFKIETNLEELTPDERYKERLKQSKPVLDDYFAWLNQSKKQVLPKSSLGKAIAYSINQWDKLSVFMQDGRIEISNNRAERAIKPFVIGRKNWLFSKSPKGAQASAVAYSIIETAKANNLNPYFYLKYLFEKLPNIDTENLEELDELMPWSLTLPEECKIPKKN